MIEIAMKSAYHYAREERKMEIIVPKLPTRQILLASSILALTSAPVAYAVEGMFTPDQLPEIAKDLRAKGLKMKPGQISDLTGFPMGAVVSLGGCTASFVSPQGLVVTNHHCAYGSIQYNSTEEQNYLEDGFLAGNLGDELPAAPGSRIFVTVDLDDVTDQVVGSLSTDLSGEERFAAIDSNRKALVSECEEDEGHRCNVSSFYGGLQYKLIKQLEIKDVRLTYAPAGAIELAMATPYGRFYLLPRLCFARGKVSGL